MSGKYYSCAIIFVTYTSQSFSQVPFEEVFPYKLLRSTRNITIERGWVYVRGGVVDDVVKEMDDAIVRKVYHDGDPVHE